MARVFNILTMLKTILLHNHSRLKPSSAIGGIKERSPGKRLQCPIIFPDNAMIIWNDVLVFIDLLGIRDCHMYIV